MARVKIPQEVQVRRLPVYNRAEADYYHWTGKLLVPRGQVITPDVVAALLAADVDLVYLEGCTRARRENLQAIDIYTLQDGVPLDFAVFDRDGNLIATEGERLTTAQLNSLHRRGQTKVYHHRSSAAGQAAAFQANYVARLRAHLDERVLFGQGKDLPHTGIPTSRLTRLFSGRPQPPHVLASYEAFYRRTALAITDSWGKIASGEYLRHKDLAQLADEILDRFLGNPEIMAALAFAQPGLPTFPEHSLATAVYALLAAAPLGYNRANARDLTVASLFHDIGYVCIPQKLLNAERALTKGERRIIFRHVEHALFLLGRVDWPGDDVPLAVYQHRERGTGAGYPSGYRADRIHPYAALVGAADVLHALLSDRPHRKAYPGSQAVNMLLKMGAVGLFDRRLVRNIARALSLYPIGACVTLSTGQLARVLAASRDPQRPWVGIILSADRARAKTTILDLSKLPAISIQEEAPPFEEPLAGF